MDHHNENIVGRPAGEACALDKADETAGGPSGKQAATPGGSQSELVRLLRQIGRLRVPDLSAPIRYALAPATTVLVVLIQHALLPEPAIAPFVFFFLAVALTSWVGGRLPGLLAVVLSAASANYLFVAPYHGWSLSAPALTATALFTVASSSVAMLCGSFREALLEVQRSLAERERVEAALSYQRDLNQAITQSSAEAIFVMDEEGRVMLVNPEAERIFGFTHEELEGRNLHGLIHHHHPDGGAFPAGECPVALIYRRGENARDHEDVFFRKDGSKVHVSWSTALLDVGGQRYGAAFMVRDITAQKLAAAERERLIEALKETDQRRSQFLAMLSHELRNPLTPIHNSLFILDRVAPVGEQARRAKAVIDRQVEQLTRLVDDLLDVTRIARGKMQLQLGRVELGELLQRTVEDHRSLMTAGGLALEVRIQEKPLWVNGDPARLAQAVGNLLSNAAKFTGKGGHVRVALDEDPARSMAVIGVRDDGAGITADLLARLFLPFEQADRTLDRSRGGLGLGLALVKGLTEQHGGEVQARSEGPGKGAEFTIRLPLVKASIASGASEAKATGRAHRRVLVIEDNADAADSLREVLAIGADDVEVAYDGPGGLAKAREFKPDVVLCDIGLPGMDGYDVARAFRADETLRATYLVALTGYALPEDVAKAKEAGFDRHLAKPPNLDKLQEILANAVSHTVTSGGQQS